MRLSRTRRASLPAIPVFGNQKKKPFWKQSMLNIGRKLRLSDSNVRDICIRGNIVFCVHKLNVESAIDIAPVFTLESTVVDGVV